MAESDLSSIFYEAFESSPAPTLIVNSKREILFSNHSLETLFGYDKAALKSRPVEILIPKSYHEKHPKYFNAYFRDPTSREMGKGRDLFGVKKSGELIPVEIGLNPIKAENETLIIATVFDLQKRQKESENFRLLINASPGAMILVDHEKKIVLVNRTTIDLFGYSEDELLGQNIKMLVPTRFQASHDQSVAHYFRKPEARMMGVGRDLMGLRKSEEEFPIEIGLNPIQTEEGLQILASVIDITERKKLSDQNKYLELIADLTDNILLVTDKDRKILWTNSAFERKTGFTLEEATGKTTKEILRGPETDQETQNYMEEKIKAGLGFEVELLNFSKKGKKIWMRVEGRPVKDDAGRVTGWVDLKQDITKDKVTKEALLTVQRTTAQAKKHAEEANALKSEFLANMSHEFRTPLQGILTCANMGLKEADDGDTAELKDYFQIIKDSSDRLLPLINNLLDLAKLEAKKVTYQFEKEDVIHVFQKLAKQYEPLAIQKDCTIEIKGSEEVLAYFDHKTLEQVIVNLFSNAIKFADSGSVIAVEVTEEQERVHCQVTNHGVGIPEEECEAVFDKFIQSKNTKTGAGGTGLGLAICQQIMKDHKGEIWVESCDKGPTTFHFTLPTQSEEE